MKEKGLRCLVELHLNKVSSAAVMYSAHVDTLFLISVASQVEWTESKEGANLQLKGGLVFLRVCLMGQLRYSDMKVPAFPVAVDLTTRFERVSLVQQRVCVEGWWVCGSRDSHVIGRFADIYKLQRPIFDTRGVEG